MAKKEAPAKKPASKSEFVSAKDLSNIVKEVEESAIVKQTLDKIRKEYNIAEVSKPEDPPKFPGDITALSSDDVGRYYASYESEVAFIRYKLAEVECIIAYAENVLKTASNTIYLSNRASMPRDEAQAWTAATKDVVAVEKYIMEKDVERRLLTARYDIFGKYAASMSREITRRKQDLEINMNNMGSRGSSASSKIRGKELSPMAKVRNKR